MFDELELTKTAFESPARCRSRRKQLYGEDLGKQQQIYIEILESVYLIITHSLISKIIFIPPPALPANQIAFILIELF